MRILSLGAGVQSSTLILLSERGLLPRLDAAIFADTRYEPRAVYHHVRWLRRQTTIPILIVSRGNLRKDAEAQIAGGRLSGDSAIGRFASMPLFTKSPEGDLGMVRRQCTKHYKLEPIRKKVRELLGLEPGERAGDRQLEQWIGISLDEMHRVRESRDYWIRLRYPLIFDLQPPWRRSDCVAWLRREYPDHVVPRSACIVCPFHSDAEWRRMRDEDPESWAEALRFDAAIRRPAGMRAECFLHAARVPLAEAPIDDVAPTQQSLFSCGVCDT